MVYLQKVAAVEVFVSFHKHVVEFLLLRLPLVGVADERQLVSDLAHQ